MKPTLLLVATAMGSWCLAGAAPPECRFECSGKLPDKLVWQTDAGIYYDLRFTDDLSAPFTRAAGFPRIATGGVMEHPFTPGPRGFFQVTASPEFVRVPAGSFEMGDSFGEGDINELPVHTVEVSEFQMSRYEVTKALWDDVSGWAAGHGYTDLPAGSGKGPAHPVQLHSWHAIVKWCNARSEREGLTPCYTVSGAVYRTGSSEPDCDFAADGYRLPTEAEWEKAARGGRSGRRFPWGNEISHAPVTGNAQAGSANYHSDGEEFDYDVSPTEGYHPDWVAGGYPFTSTVGAFEANGYDIHDMAVNVWEWCWDRFSNSYYSSSPEADPRGPESGSLRVVRGGGWYSNAYRCRTACRNFSCPSGAIRMGFRLARSELP